MEILCRNGFSLKIVLNLPAAMAKSMYLCIVKLELVSLFNYIFSHYLISLVIVNELENSFKIIPKLIQIEKSARECSLLFFISKFMLFTAQ